MLYLILDTGSSLAFPISGLVLEGAGWSEIDNTLTFSRDVRTAMTLCHLRWTRRDGPEENSAEGAKATCPSRSKSCVSVPVYLHGERSELILTVELPIPCETPAVMWRQRGVALLAWGPAV